MQIPIDMVPIIGTRQLSHIAECSAATALKLTSSAWYEVLTAARSVARIRDGIGG